MWFSGFYWNFVSHDLCESVSALFSKTFITITRFQKLYHYYYFKHVKSYEKNGVKMSVSKNPKLLPYPFPLIKDIYILYIYIYIYQISNIYIYIYIYIYLIYIYIYQIQYINLIFGFLPKSHIERFFGKKNKINKSIQPILSLYVATTSCSWSSFQNIL